MKGYSMLGLTRIVKWRQIYVHDGFDWCEVIIDLDVSDQEIFLNANEQIVGNSLNS